MKVTNQEAQVKADTAKESSFKDKLEKAKDSGDKEELREAAQEFESYFVGLLLKEMRKGTQALESGFIEKSHSREMFESMYDEELSKSISKNGGIGLADMIYEQLSKMDAAEQVQTTDGDTEKADKEVTKKPETAPAE